jgi:2-(1,2-epoxy-1,2-dihydrophenyl)acetyl-CoA isomerase
VASPSYHPNILLGKEGHITTITIDSPETKNACTGDMWVALGATFRDVAFSGARVIVLTGAGGDFCAGANLSGGGGPSSHMLHSMRVLGDVVLAVHDCPVPVVAKVDGVCVGAGLGLALACDMIWSSDRARFSAIFAKRGLSLDFGTSWLLGQRVGISKAKELALTGKIINAADALRIGLVNAVAQVGELDQATREIVDAIAAGPPLALSMTKRELNAAPQFSLAQALEVEALAQSVNVETDDTKEALAAYSQRRTPNFSGR